MALGAPWLQPGLWANTEPLSASKGFTFRIDPSPTLSEALSSWEAAPWEVLSARSEGVRRG